MNDKCPFCKNRFKYASIKEYTHWDLQLFVDDQYYIGRTVAVLQGRHITNIKDLTLEERNELFEKVLPNINNALDNIFSPDLYNYSSLGNDCSHVHMHIIPRYKEVREFEGEKFKDEYWNKTYSQGYRRVKLNRGDRNKLINQIRENI